jgi:diadenosine tetraphosphate (Ap4A) HIT family hydrolase
VPDPERLWSPWRMDYIRRGDQGDRGCIFCDLPAADPAEDEANHLLARGEVGFVLLNAFPYNPGHLMAAPYRHVGDYEELTAAELAELTALIGRAIRAMQKESGPHGFNLGMNLGQVAGTTSTCTWSRAGAATPTSCPWSARPRSCPSCSTRPTGASARTSRRRDYVPVSSPERLVTMINPTEER